METRGWIDMISFRVGVLQVAHAFQSIAQVADAGTWRNKTATTAAPAAIVDRGARLLVQQQLLPLLLPVMTVTMTVRQRGVWIGRQKAFPKEKRERTRPKQCAQGAAYQQHLAM